MPCSQGLQPDCCCVHLPRLRQPSRFTSASPRPGPNTSQRRVRTARRPRRGQWRLPLDLRALLRMSAVWTPFDSRIQHQSRLDLHRRSLSIGTAVVALVSTVFPSTRTRTLARPPRLSESACSACTAPTGLTWLAVAWMTWCGRLASSPWPPLLGCRGIAPTEAPHTRWRGLGPGTGMTAATGSASGPAITLDNRCWRRAINVATSITSAESIVLEGFSVGADRNCAIILRHS